MIIIIMHTFQFCRYLREAPKEHTYPRSLKEDWNCPVENYQKLRCFCITKIRLGEIFSMKKA